jgi:photosystem II stability/assembly factor-like uncharacterized protein
MRILLLIIPSIIFSTAIDTHAQSLQLKKIDLPVESYFRGISVVDDAVAWISGSRGTVGRTIDGGKTWQFVQPKGFERLDFRSLFAFDSLHAVMANAGSPAYILATRNGGKNWKQLYINSHPDAFIDGVDFWNSNEGIFYGDAVRGRMLLVRTTDGGKTWTEINEELRPQLLDGEGSFAASGTNIRCLPSGKTFIATGGLVSRLFISNDKARSWSVVKPPVIQGKTMTGIFSIAFGNDVEGILVGGDYEIDTLRQDHIFLTHDGGKSWVAPKMPTGGIRESVEYLTNSLIVACGFPGVEYSSDGGVTWNKISDERGYAAVRKARNGKLIILTGNKIASILIINGR